MDLLRYYAETADQVQRLLRVTANGDSCSWLARQEHVFSCLFCHVSGLRLGHCLISACGLDHAELRMLLVQYLVALSCRHERSCECCASQASSLRRMPVLRSP